MLSSQPTGRGFNPARYQRVPGQSLIAANSRRAIHHRSAGRTRDRERQEFDMSDWNAKTIAEFRANEGRVGGIFEGAPLVLVHHRGRKTGREYVSNRSMYLPHDTEPDIVYVFATKGGAPTNPDWYYNLTAAGERQCRTRNRDIQGDRPQSDGRRTRPHLRRASAALPRLCRVRTPNCWSPHHSCARTWANVSLHTLRPGSEGAGRRSRKTPASIDWSLTRRPAVDTPDGACARQHQPCGTQDPGERGRATASTTRRTRETVTATASDPGDPLHMPLRPGAAPVSSQFRPRYQLTGADQCGSRRSSSLGGAIAPGGSYER